MATEHSVLIRDNIHGLDVFVDDPRVKIVSMNATAGVLADPQTFLSFASDLHGQAASISRQAQEVILLLNYALMRPEPVAQIVFAISAVEMLGQQETWTESQKHLLAELAVSAETSSLGSEEERLEVADAIKKNLHRLSLRQGVLRLFERLDLAHLKGKWDSVYAERSRLVHGLAPRPGANYSELAQKAVSLCGYILLKALAAELPIASRYTDEFYKLP
ncbi:hypothetical protein AAW51_5291 [Caldimonas brevitalea]|uniref:Apea-like HEPN domain-containing protein n=2 Tax=Caldimonas brevitalea TaxID=413882 RepID=A0A0G3BRD5_9BURK|nr:hypothetical protein AAW51_5291 [Caldimonas brevitalea]